MASAGVKPSVRYTLEFVLTELPTGARQVLEVGCGTGELALALAGEGLKVVAVDNDREAVEAARALGVDARAMSWPAAIGDQYDAILFTRSLHHIHDLEGAVSAAVNALRPGGRIVVEDFRAEGASEKSRAWAEGLIRLLDASRAFRSAEAADAAIAKIHPSEDDHAHDLHSSEAIAAALSRHGEVEVRAAAYFFRYLEPELPETAGAALLRHELELIESGGIDALGKRFVLTPRR